jgi:hypothetical protein
VLPETQVWQAVDTFRRVWDVVKSDFQAALNHYVQKTQEPIPVYDKSKPDMEREEALAEMMSLVAGGQLLEWWVTLQKRVHFVCLHEHLEMEAHERMKKYSTPISSVINPQRGGQDHSSKNNQTDCSTTAKPDVTYFAHFLCSIK